MPGATNFIRGATGPAPTTVWFGALPDRLNMLAPKHPSGGTPLANDQYIAANYLNQWTIWNQNFGGGSNVLVATLGGFTTAPDGTTNTAQLLVEAAVNAQHFTSSGCVLSQFAVDCGWYRVAGFFKSAGRRIILGVLANFATGGGAVTSQSGAKAIFDLAGGQVGVQSAVFGTAPNFEVTPAVIVPYSNGFFLCYFDVHINYKGIVASAIPIVFAMLDNGTGTNAESSTYAGDGVSGVYGWRTNMMPDRAWGMGTRVFFDDFLDPTMANWDWGFTQQPGFTWYPDTSNPQIPGVGGSLQSFKPDFVIANSILTIDGGGNAGAHLDQISTAAAQGHVSPTPFVGTTFKLPALFEGRMSYSYFLQTPTNTRQTSLWNLGMEFVCNQPFIPNNIYGAQHIGVMGMERDFYESVGGGRPGTAPTSTEILYEENANGQLAPNIGGGYNGGQSANVGTAVGKPDERPIWGASFIYALNDIVFNPTDSQFYISLQANNNANRPDLSPTFWTVYTTTPPPLTFKDFTQLHVYSGLVLPYDKVRNRQGQWLQFFDGLFCSLIDCWAPSPSDGSVGNLAQVADYASYDLRIFGFGNGASFPLSVDWVSVTQ